MDDLTPQQLEIRAERRGWLLLALRARWAQADAFRRRGRRVAWWMASHLQRRSS